MVLLDDLLKDETAKSETKREQVKNTFTDVVIPIGTKDTNILVVGTVLHEEDLMAELLKGKIPGVRSIRRAAVICFSDRDDLWGKWEMLYNDLGVREMEKELELAKQLAVLGKIYHMSLLSETEYIAVKKRIMREYNVVSFMNM